ncbi:hypothetical protein MK435_02950 [Streptococcus oralis]|jgi:hypothetical protein|uniref:DUF6985 domain-containing protein n=1 Tax=Streptococcus oralis subsp. oralis TaxID=1891914 RepID=A0A1X1INI6_STROR|nr:hypothetical protein [Streptococcus oralis]MBT3114310.1 hypothetical protein [Streptococcus oralis]MBU6872857.1 hypothetical protein [Streptococcus oralis]MCY7074460.1 hypothetical protein [Streptococcus oralis]MCY7109832.1 hypothetical protein [Streptococcus oralis]ORO74694.1 hypothetical protein B7710_00815 [Streptococcus oralis subsp. oralis]
MEINHQTFGKLKYNYGWTKDISLDIFNKRHVLEINIDADEDAEFEINQEKAYIFFENYLDEIAKEVDVAIVSYYNREISDIVSSYTNHKEKQYFLDIIGDKDKIYSLLQPKKILFPLTFDENVEEFGFLCECDWDKENGIGIKFVNGVLSEIGFQDILL